MPFFFARCVREHATPPVLFKAFDRHRWCLHPSYGRHFLLSNGRQQWPALFDVKVFM
jgi:hypothetical protein